MDINLELYKTFYQVAEHLSFSAAAEVLCISQSAVSQNIKTLEKKLDRTLFVRSTKKVRLTRDGELLCKHVAPALQLISRGEATLRDAVPGTGQLRIAASDTICRYFLVPFLNRFHAANPNAHLKVTNATSSGCIELLNKNQVELVIVNYPNVRIAENNTVRKIKAFADIFVGNDSYRDLTSAPVTFRQLSRLPLLMLSQASTTSQFLHREFQQHQVELVPEIELSSNDLLIDLAKIGLGIAFIPDYCLTAANRLGLHRIATKETLPGRHLAAVTNERLPLGDLARDFLALLLPETAPLP